jgi:hypothetical protein
MHDRASSPKDAQVFEARDAGFDLWASSGFLFGFLLAPGQTGFVLWKQLSLFHGLCGRLGSSGRRRAA